MRMPNHGGIGNAHPMNIEEFTHEDFNLSEKGFIVALILSETLNLCVRQDLPKSDSK